MLTRKLAKRVTRPLIAISLATWILSSAATAISRGTSVANALKRKIGPAWNAPTVTRVIIIKPLGLWFKANIIPTEGHTIRRCPKPIVENDDNGDTNGANFGGASADTATPVAAEGNWGGDDDTGAGW